MYWYKVFAVLLGCALIASALPATNNEHESVEALLNVDVQGHENQGDRQARGYGGYGGGFGGRRGGFGGGFGGFGGRRGGGYGGYYG